MLEHHAATMHRHLKLKHTSNHKHMTTFFFAKKVFSPPKPIHNTMRIISLQICIKTWGNNKDPEHEFYPQHLFRTPEQYLRVLISKDIWWFRIVKKYFKLQTTCQKNDIWYRKYFMIVKTSELLFFSKTTNEVHTFNAGVSITL